MTDQDSNRPDACTFPLLAGMALSLLVYQGFSALALPAGLLLVIAAVLAGVKALRWALSRIGSNGGPPSFA